VKHVAVIKMVTITETRGFIISLTSFGPDRPLFGDL
jgi:hypothetical protein